MTQSQTSSAINADSLTEALVVGRSIESGTCLRSCSAVAIGAGQLADSFRVDIGYEPGSTGPTSVFVKLPASDVHSAATAARIGAYTRERRFYEELLPHLKIRTPRLLGFLIGDGEEPGMVLEDLSDRTRPLDQLRDGSIDEVASAFGQLAGLQVPFWNDPEMGSRPWFYNRTTDHIAGLHERYAVSWSKHQDTVGAKLDKPQREMVAKFGALCVEWAAGIGGPSTLVHQDLRLDNLLYGDSGAWIVDWQTLAWGSPAWDLSFLLGSALAPEVRRFVERRLVSEHVAALETAGISDWGPERAWQEYRRLGGAVLLAMVPAMAFVQPTSRGFEMFASLIARGAQQAIDLEVLDFI